MAAEGWNCKSSYAEDDVVPAAAAAANTSNNSSSSSSSSSKSKLQKRLEMPMGEKPAAKVAVERRLSGSRGISAGGGRGRPIAVPSVSKVVVAANWESSSSKGRAAAAAAAAKKNEEEQSQQPPFSALGSVVERPRQRKQQQLTGNVQVAAAAAAPHSTFSTAAVSRFAQSRQHHHHSGFPSLQAPLGTFLTVSGAHNNDDQQKQQQQPHAVVSTTASIVVKLRAAAPAAAATTMNATTMAKTMINNNSNDPRMQLQSLQEASANDAQNMLAAMSVDEIRESVQELSASLDPAVLAFLKQRNRSRRKSSSSDQSEQHHQPTTRIMPKAASMEKRTNESVTPTAAAAVPTLDDKVAAEKNQMAELLSSIQSYDDLDAANEAHQQSQTEESSEGGGLPHQTNISTGKDELSIACDLLRSTSPQQTLWACRVVCRRLLAELQKDTSATAYSLLPLTSESQPSLRAQKSGNINSSWPFPTLLPVSLRCLLDVNVVSHRTGGMLQTTYVLQSLYALLQLRACVDHVVDVATTIDGSTGSSRDAAVSYQRDCLDDTVPTLPLKSCYAAAAAPAQPVVTSSGGISGDDKKNLGGVVAAYSTLSSSTSAQADGEAFLRDPMWTLLSKMRIIPRLSQLLRQGSVLAADDDDSESSEKNQRPLLPIPVEALVAICGILAMIGQRSPGAASAIVQHSTLMDDLVSLTLVRKEGSARYDPALALPAMRLMCTLARQSRAAAQGLCYRTTESSSILLQALASGRATATTTSSSAATAADFELQRWTLVLWRTFLRYGLCLDILPTVLTLAAPYLTLGMREPLYSLAPELYTSFACILCCVRVLRLQPESRSGPNAISDDQRSILSNAWVWLSSLKRQAMQHLLTLGDESSLQNCETLRFVTSILRYLHALLAVTRDDESSGSAAAGEFMAEDATEVEVCIEALTSIVQSKGMSAVVITTLQLALSPDFNDTSLASDVSSMRFEACASTFLDALLSVIATVLHWSGTSDELRRNAESLADELGKLLVSTLESIHRSNEDSLSSGTTFIAVDTSRLHWLNRVHASTVSFLHETKERSWNDVRISRAIAFAVIGRLGCGDERTAAILFSFDNLYQTLTSNRSQLPSAVSTLLVRELCRTPKSRYQLDHSFRLNFGLGIAAVGLGPFDMQSLLSEAEDLEPGRNASDNLLPIGKYWLWKLLSGSSTQPWTPENQGGSEATDVILSTLQTIVELESNNSTDCFSPANRLSVGPKLYYLANICLHEEGVVSQNRIGSLAGTLFDQYFLSLTAGDVAPLADECRKHLDPRPANETDKSTSLNSLTEEDQVKAILEPYQPTDTSFSPANLRSLEAFVGDLCDAFLDYGAHYAFFTKCVRLFLAIGFPTKIRCLVVQRLRGALHLLTLDDDGELRTLLRRFITGGMPSVDKSGRDGPELLDCISTLFSKETVARPDDIFGAAWATGLLARSLGIDVSMSLSSGKSVSKRRIKYLEPTFASRVVRTAASWLSTEGTLDDLIGATLHCDLSEELPKDFCTGNFLADSEWERTVDVLRSIKRLSPQATPTHDL